MTAIPQPRAAGPRAALWKTAQLLGVGATAVLLAGLVWKPDLALLVLWNVLIPVLPASFLLTAEVWRNVCPLATLNLMPGRGATRLTGHSATRLAPLIGILLLWILVPARRALFNEHGLVLMVTVTAVALLALSSGLLFEVKAGFCNSICPVLPVERLYGQQPLVDVSNRRCPSCTLCTSPGCMDLSADKSLYSVLGKPHNDARWLLTPFGVFAASFPGFVFGYFQASNTDFAGLAQVYTGVGLAMAASYAITAVLVLVLRMRAVVAVRLLGAAAVGLYYWYTIPAVGEELRLPAWSMTALDIGILLLLVLWLVTGLNHARFREKNGGFHNEPGS